MKDLHDIGLRGRLPNFISNFLSDRFFNVRIGSTLSDTFEQEQGVPQGSILSPTLFNIKINSIVKCVNDTDSSLYVDDFGIFYKSKNMENIELRLQRCLNKVETRATENGFKFSKTKTQCVHFCQLRGLHPDPVLNIYGSPIPVVEEAKFLGLLFDKKLSFIPHIKALKAKCLKAFNSTYRYLDDLLNIDNNFFDSMVNRIYPSELQLNKANVSDAEASFLDLHLSILDGFVKTKIYDKRDDFDFDIVNFPFLDGDVPRSASYGVYISQLIRFARVSSHVDDFNTRNKVLTAKLLRQGYRYHKLRKAFSKFYRRHFDIVSKYNVGLKTLLLQGLSEPEFYGDLVYKFRKIIGKIDFPYHFKKIIVRYKKIGYNINVMRQTACLVVNPIKVNSFAYLFNCTTVGRTSD